MKTPIICDYCNVEIKDKTAKYDPLNKVYLHDGPSFTDLDNKEIMQGNPRGIIGAIFSAPNYNKATKERIKEWQRNSNEKICAQFHKLERVVKGNPVILNVVSLEDLSE